MKTLDPISVIEAAYRVDAPAQEWLTELAAAANAAAGIKRGAMAVLYDASRVDWVDVLAAAAHDVEPAFVHGLFTWGDRVSEVTAEDRRVVADCYRSVRVGSYAALLPPSVKAVTSELFERFDLQDLLCINATDPTARGCLLLVAMSRAATPTKRSQRLWGRLAAHVAAGARLRRSFVDLEARSVVPAQNAEAILTANGRVAHAVGPAKHARGRQSLREGLARMASARSRQVEPEKGVELWEALVAGRWSIVEHFESDGKRHYLAHRNDPELVPDRALTEKERQILGFAQHGDSNKLIAYTLGLSVSAVSTALTRARRKLGIF